MRADRSCSRWFTAEQDGNITVIRFDCPGLIDYAAVHDVERRLDRLLTEAGCRRFVLNLGPVQAMTSLMVGKLIWFNKRVKASGGRLALCSLAPDLHARFERTKLSRLFGIFADEQAAVEGLASRSAAEPAPLPGGPADRPAEVSPPLLLPKEPAPVESRPPEA